MFGPMGRLRHPKLSAWEYVHTSEQTHTFLTLTFNLTTQTSLTNNNITNTHHHTYIHQHLQHIYLYSC